MGVSCWVFGTIRSRWAHAFHRDDRSLEPSLTRTPGDHEDRGPARWSPDVEDRHRGQLGAPRCGNSPWADHTRDPGRPRTRREWDCWRRRAESNRRTGLCRPLPKPLGHAALAPGDPILPTGMLESLYADRNDRPTLDPHP